MTSTNLPATEMSHLKQLLPNLNDENTQKKPGFPTAIQGMQTDWQEAQGKLNGKIFNHLINTFCLNPSVLKVALCLEQPQKLASMDHPHTVPLHADKHQCRISTHIANSYL